MNTPRSGRPRAATSTEPRALVLTSSRSTPKRAQEIPAEIKAICSVMIWAFFSGTVLRDIVKNGRHIKERTISTHFRRSKSFGSKFCISTK